MNAADNLEKTVCDPAYKAVSFDIFDTLLVRPCLRPTDIFRLAGRAAGCSEAFTDLRRACEAAARREHSRSEDITTADIYDVMRRYLGLDPERAAEIMRAELECERALLRPRESMKRIFALAKQAGKTVIVISDMYLSEEFLGNILNGCGYDGYDRLYVSSEYNAAKYSGKLFKIAAEDMKKRGIKPSEILHIGDNEYSDAEQARRRGFAAYHIPSTAEAARRGESCRRLLSLTDPKSDNTYLIGYMINRYYDLPLPDGINPAEAAAAPLLMSLALRILSDCAENGVKRLIFPENEGELLEEVTALAAAYVLPALEITQESGHDGACEAVFAAEKNGSIAANRVYTLFSGGAPRAGIIPLIQQGAISRRLYGETAAEIKALINCPTDNAARGRILDHCRGFCALFGDRLGLIHPEPYQFYEFLRDLHL
ncbi:MAG: HAD family hydrolase [Oscillospiraceae bacterium]